MPAMCVAGAGLSLRLLFVCVSPSPHWCRTRQQAINTNNPKKNSNATSVPESSEVFAERLATAIGPVIEVSRSYLRAGLTCSATQYWDRARSNVDTYISWMTIGSAVFGCGMVLFFVFVYSRWIQRLDQDIKQTRSMLLMFPAEVIESVTAIRRTMLDVAVREESQFG